MSEITQLLLIARDVHLHRTPDGKLAAVKVFGQWLHLPEPQFEDTGVVDDEEAIVIDLTEFNSFDDYEVWGYGG